MATVNAIILVAFSVHQVTEVSRGQLVTASKTLGLGRHVGGEREANLLRSVATGLLEKRIVKIPPNGQSRTEFSKVKVL